MNNEFILKYTYGTRKSWRPFVFQPVLANLKIYFWTIVSFVSYIRKDKYI